MSNLISDGTIYSVRCKAQEALDKHGPATGDPVRALAILSEELGEVAECAVNITSPTRLHTPDSNASWLRSLRVELLQLAAYALLQVENIDSGKVNAYVAVQQAANKEEGLKK